MVADAPVLLPSKAEVGSIVKIGSPIDQDLLSEFEGK